MPENPVAPGADAALVPGVLIRDPRVSSLAVRVWAYIASYSQPYDDNPIGGTVQWLADGVGESNKGLVVAAMNRLEDCGYLLIDHSDHGMFFQPLDGDDL